MHYLCARDRIFRLNNQRIARFSIVRIDPYRIYRLIKYREIMKKIIQRAILFVPLETTIGIKQGGNEMI